MLKPDSALGRFLTGILYQMLLNLFFLVSALPVVTVGAALTALYAAEFALMERGDQGVLGLYWREFLSGFKRSLAEFLILGGAVVAATAVLAVCAHRGIRLPALAMGALGLVLLVDYAVACWTFPLTACFEERALRTLRNALMMTVAFLPVTVLLMALGLFFPALFLVVPKPLLQTYTGFLIFFSASLTARLAVIPLARVFRRFGRPTNQGRGHGGEDHEEQEAD